MRHNVINPRSGVICFALKGSASHLTVFGKYKKNHLYLHFECNIFNKITEIKTGTFASVFYSSDFGELKSFACFESNNKLPNSFQNSYLVEYNNWEGLSGRVFALRSLYRKRIVIV